jgi:hypothetical protein
MQKRDVILCNFEHKIRYNKVKFKLLKKIGIKLILNHIVLFYFFIESNFYYKLNFQRKNTSFCGKVRNIRYFFCFRLIKIHFLTFKV